MDWPCIFFENNAKKTTQKEKLAAIFPVRKVDEWAESGLTNLLTLILVFVLQTNYTL